MRWSVAIELDTELREFLSELPSELHEEFPEVSWLNSEQLFVSIKFLGNPERKRLGQIKKKFRAAAAHVAPFELSIDSLGCFPSEGQPRTLWAGVSDSSFMLRRFQKELNQALGREEEDFVPHIPLGRIGGKMPKRPIGKVFSSLSLEAKQQIAREAALVQSKLTKSGPSYEVVARAPFAAQVLS